MTEQLSFFDPHVEPEKPKNGLTCRRCKSIYKHEYGKMLYCRRLQDTRTTYGNKKIKAGDPACYIFTDRKIKKDILST